MQQVDTLNKEVLGKLKDLVRVNIDSAEGFRSAADTIESQPIASLFRDIAQARESHASELQSVLRFAGEDIPDSGTVKGSLHRWWTKARGTLNGGDDHVMLIEAERGEDAIKARYEDVLPKIAGNAINDVLLRHYAEVKRGHDSVRDLRDAKK